VPISPFALRFRLSKKFNGQETESTPNLRIDEIPGKVPLRLVRKVREAAKLLQSDMSVLQTTVAVEQLNENTHEWVLHRDKEATDNYEPKAGKGGV